MEEQTKLLQNLGLQEYQAKAFAALLAKSEATATNIAEVSGVPLTKLYSVLKSLEDLGFVKCSLSRPKLYRPIDVKSIVEMVIAKKQDRINEITKKREKIIASLNDLYDGGKKFESQKNMVWFVNNAEAGYLEMARILETSKKRIYSVATYEDWKAVIERNTINRSWAHAVLLNNVECKAIIPPFNIKYLKILYEILLKGKKNIKNENILKNYNVEFRILDKKRINFSIIIKDDSEVIMGLSRDSATSLSKHGLLLHDKEVVKGMTEYFLNMWDNAKSDRSLYSNFFINFAKKFI